MPTAIARSLGMVDTTKHNFEILQSYKPIKVLGASTHALELSIGFSDFVRPIIPVHA